MRSHDRPEAVVSVTDSGSPLSHRFGYGILQRRRARLYRDHLRAEQPHAINVESLADGVLLSHEHDTFHAHQRSCRCRRHAVLACSCLRDQAGLAHLLRKQGLAEHIVDLVRSCMIQVFAL